MKLVSFTENQDFEKRIAVTPESAKKYSSIGFEVCLPKNYGAKLGIKDQEYNIVVRGVVRVFGFSVEETNRNSTFQSV